MSEFIRNDGRKTNQLRPIKITPNFQKAPHGSCFIEMGNTRVVCSAMWEENVPPFLRNSGKGWLTAEYSMLPASSKQRIQRERQKVGGRTHEIQRLIGRSLRGCFDLKMFGERTLLIDCDVLDADGGTRTASITGAYVACALAIKKYQEKHACLVNSIKCGVAAISVGLLRGVPLLDLDYSEDKDAHVDMNIVRTTAGQYLEVQGTGEGASFNKTELLQMLELADAGISELFLVQQSAING